MPDYQDLDIRLHSLEELIDVFGRPIFGTTAKDEWDRIFTEIEKVQEEFKSVRYPTRLEREEAWKRFCDLRNEAYQARRDQWDKRSEEHCDELLKMLHDADYDPLAAGLGQLVTFGILKVTRDDMIERGQLLKEASNQFTAVKREMSGKHKSEVYERMIRVRENHDIFWERYREYKDEYDKVREEKSRLAKERIENNLEKNNRQLLKAEEFLSKLMDDKEEIEEKISSAWSDSFREKMEDKLSKLEDKIKEVEEQIEKYKEWIREDEEKLDNWDD